MKKSTNSILSDETTNEAIAPNIGYAQLVHGSLFSGIGGFDLAADWMGWENAFHCEWNSFGQKILKYYWPKATSYEDITKTDFSIWRGRIDVLTGGFPCQPYSVAGKRKGKEDERHLWPEMLRAIREIQPSYVVGENVRGLTNWNGGLVFDEVQSDLEAQGYEVLPFLLPACAVNAPHRRDRIWFIAYSNHKGRSSGFGEISKKNGEISKRNENTQFSNTNDRISENTYSNGRENNKRKEKPNIREQRNFSTGNNEPISTDNDEIRNVAYSCNKRCYNGCYNRKERHFQNDKGITEESKSEWSGREFRACEISSNVTNPDSRRQSCKEYRETQPGQFTKKSFSGNWENFPTQSPICNGNDGISSRLDIETILKSVGRKVNKSFKPFSWWRNESIKGGGNAIVPHVAFQIFKAIDLHINGNSCA